jgi:shikimate kinase
MTSPEQRNLVLTGFMGTGKTTIGRLTAQALDLPFIDSDVEITRRTKMTIPEIFEHFGEPGFRHIESVMCRWLSRCDGAVISTGGGMLVNLRNLAAMSQTGLVICLTAAPEVIEMRLRGSASDRPLAANWQALYEQRRSAYAAIPHQVDTTDKSPHQVVEEVIALWQS